MKNQKLTAQPNYKPTIFRRALLLIWLPSFTGIITFALLNQLWLDTMRVYKAECVETEMIGHLNQAIRHWGAVSAEYSRLLFGNMYYSVPDRGNNELQMQSELNQAERLAKVSGAADMKTAADPVISKIRSLFAQEKETFEQLALKRSEIIAALSPLGSDDSRTSSRDLERVLENTYRNLSEIKSAEQIILDAKWIDLKRSRANQSEALNRFSLAVYAALILNVILSASLAWVVSLPIVRRMRVLRSSSESFLHGNLEILALENDDEFSYLQKTLRNSFEKIFFAASRRKTILAMVAHDIRTPLMSASANLNLMEEYSNGFPDEAIDVLMDVYAGLRQVLISVEKILGDEKDIAPELIDSDSPSGSKAVPVKEGFASASTFLCHFWSRFIFSPSVFQQILSTAILPLIIQVVCLAFLGGQLTNTVIETNKASHCSDILIVTNLTLLNSLIATSQHALYLLTGDWQAKKLAQSYLKEAIAQNQQALIIAHTDALAKQYSQLFSEELITSEHLRSEVPKKFGLTTSLAYILKTSSEHDFSLNGNDARMLEKSWVKTNMVGLDEASDRSTNRSKVIRTFIYLSLLLYLASELIVLLFFFLSTNRRIHILIEEAKLLGKAGFEDVSKTLSGNDEIAELGKSLEKADYKLTEAAIKRTRILRYLAREMSEPLMKAISDEKNFLALAKENISEKSLIYLNNSGNSIAQVLSVVNDLLTIERLVEGKGHLKNIEVSSVDLFEKAVAAVVGLAKLKDITITTACEPGKIYADSAQLIRVLINLISNAIKFSSPGTQIKLTGRFEHGALKMEVTDEGPGISQDEIRNLFEPGYRVSVPNQSQQGHGLGLAISKMIIESHGGQISVTSEKGKGSTFFFSIPVAPVSEPA